MTHHYSKFLERIPAAKLWLDIGLIPRAAKALCEAGYCSVEQLRPLRREDFLAIRGTGEVALARCEEALGKPLSSERQYWKDQGVTGQAAAALMRLGIKSVEELKAWRETVCSRLSAWGLC